MTYGHGVSATIGYLRDLVQKQIVMCVTWVRVDPTLPYTHPYVHQLSLLNVDGLHPTLFTLHTRLPFARQRNSLVHIIVMARAELDCMFNNTTIKKRCVIPHSFPRWCVHHMLTCLIKLLHRMHRFAVLAMSSSLSDISHQTDFQRFSLNSHPIKCLCSRSCMSHCDRTA
jgi:hypothetical protein